MGPAVMEEGRRRGSGGGGFLFLVAKQAVEFPQVLASINNCSPMIKKIKRGVFCKNILLELPLYIY